MFTEIFELSRKSILPLFVRNSKLMEEVGEFSEALMFHEGYLPHKVMKEPLEGEAADVVICVLDTLCAAYPDLSPTVVSVMLQRQLEKKSDKWRGVIATQLPVTTKD